MLEVLEVNPTSDNILFIFLILRVFFFFFFILRRTIFIVISEEGNNLACLQPPKKKNFTKFNSPLSFYWEGDLLKSIVVEFR